MTQRQSRYLVGFVCLAFCVVLWGVPGAAQTNTVEFRGALGVDTIWVPNPPFFSNAEFDLDVSLSLLDVVFASKTRFNLDDVLHQRLSLSVRLAELSVRNELRFKTGLAFDRNLLEASAKFAALTISNQLILRDINLLAPPAVRLGWVFGFLWQINGVFRLGSAVGFGVNEIIEDLDHDRDHEIDLNVQNVFAFSEAVIHPQLVFSPLLFETITVLQPGGFQRQVFGVALLFDDPAINLSARLTLNQQLLISRIGLTADIALHNWRWRTKTIVEGGGPFLLTFQLFEVSLMVFDGVVVRAESRFGQIGLQELRFGIRWIF